MQGWRCALMKGQALSPSALKRLIRRYGCRHSQPPIDFVEAPQWTENRPQKFEIWGMSEKNGIVSSSRTSERRKLPFRSDRMFCRPALFAEGQSTLNGAALCTAIISLQFIRRWMRQGGLATAFWPKASARPMSG